MRFEDGISSFKSILSNFKCSDAARHMLAPLSGNTGKVIESIFIELKRPGVMEANISLLDVGEAGVYVSFVGLEFNMCD